MVRSIFLFLRCLVQSYTRQEEILTVLLDVFNCPDTVANVISTAPVAAPTPKTFAPIGETSMFDETHIEGTRVGIQDVHHA